MGKDLPPDQFAEQWYLVIAATGWKKTSAEKYAKITAKIIMLLLFCLILPLPILLQYLQSLFKWGSDIKQHKSTANPYLDRPTSA